MNILVVNSGSSTVKVRLFDMESEGLLFAGDIHGVGAPRGRIVIGSPAGGNRSVREDVSAADHREGLRLLAAKMSALGDGLPPPAGIGHRVVHGGELFTSPCIADDTLLEELSLLNPLAPLHNPANLAGIAMARELFPGVPQAVCFDTAFHATQPAEATAIALPAAYRAGGLRRYGFHGLSFEHIAAVLPGIAGGREGGRVVAAHLGSGVSLCAMENLQSVDTSMGFSTLDGPPMATRSGSLDPGVILHLLTEEGMNSGALTDLLYHRSGLLGLSGISGDMQTLLADPSPPAAAAVGVFVYRVVREIGSLAAALGGLDLLVFTGGIGENSSSIREKICTPLSWLGVAIDEGRSGLGAVMGSKKLKAIVAVGDAKVAMADQEGMKQAMDKHRKFMRDQPFFWTLDKYGTAGITAGACATADTPIKNWGGVPDDFPTAAKISDDEVMAIQKRKWGCWKCPIACGGLTEVKEGEYASDTHKPEYETLGAFGTMCLNDNLESIHLCNEYCNQYGMDTISTGCTVAFAVECYENGLLTKEDTGGLELTWGNHQAIAEVTRQIAVGEGFGGKVLADGAKAAAERIGKGAEQYAIHVAGEETAMHDPRLNPGLATSYKMDATPGRHTQMSAWTVEGEFAPPGLVKEKVERRQVEGKGQVYRTVAAHHHVCSAAGMCLFAWAVLKPEALTDSLKYTTGKEYTLDDVQQMGDRISALRMAFNIREGVRNVDLKMPGRMIGSPPLEAGPLKDVTVDLDTQVRDYLQAMGWDSETGVPTKETLEGLGLDFVAADLHPAGA